MLPDTQRQPARSVNPLSRSITASHRVEVDIAVRPRTVHIDPALNAERVGVDRRRIRCPIQVLPPRNRHLVLRRRNVQKPAAVHDDASPEVAGTTHVDSLVAHETRATRCIRREHRPRLQRAREALHLVQRLRRIRVRVEVPIGNQVQLTRPQRTRCRIRRIRRAVQRFRRIGESVTIRVRIVRTRPRIGSTQEDPVVRFRTVIESVGVGIRNQRARSRIRRTHPRASPRLHSVSKTIGVRIRVVRLRSLRKLISIAESISIKIPSPRQHRQVRRKTQLPGIRKPITVSVIRPDQRRRRRPRRQIRNLQRRQLSREERHVVQPSAHRFHLIRRIPDEQFREIGRQRRCVVTGQHLRSVHINPLRVPSLDQHNVVPGRQPRRTRIHRNTVEPAIAAAAGVPVNRPVAPWRVRTDRARHRRRVRKERRLVPHFTKVLPERNRQVVRRSRRIQEGRVRHVHPVAVVPKQHRSISSGSSPAASRDVKLGTAKQYPDVTGMGINRDPGAHIVEVPPRDQIAGVSALGKAQ